MTIYLVESSDKGHQPHYVQLCATALLELGCNVVSVVPNSTVEYKSLPVDPNHTIVKYPAFKSFSGRGGGLLTRWNRKLTEIRLCKALSKSSKQLSSLIYYPTISGPDFKQCKYVFEVMNQNWAGLYISASELRRGFPDSYHKPIVTELFNSDKCKQLFTNDAGVIDQLSELVSAQIGFFPEVVAVKKLQRPVDVPQVLAEMFDVVAGRTIITHAGLLTKRKGIMNFVNAILTIKNANVVFNIVGPISLSDFTVEESKYIESVWASDHRVRIYRKSVTSEVFQWLLERTDLVFAVYDQWTQGSSVLTHASYAGVPSLVPADSCMADLCSRYNLGWVVDPLLVSDYSHLYNRFELSRTSNDFAFKDHLRLNSYENVINAMKQLIA